MNTEAQKEPLYYPCITDPKTGRISLKLLQEPMTREQTEDYLKRHYPRLWLKCEAIPQPVDHHYFK